MAQRVITAGRNQQRLDTNLRQVIFDESITRQQCLATLDLPDHFSRVIRRIIRLPSNNRAASADRMMF